jgi:hypothetical protein
LNMLSLSHTSIRNEYISTVVASDKSRKTNTIESLVSLWQSH